MQIGTSTFSVIEKHPNIWYQNLQPKVWPHQGTNPDQYPCFAEAFEEGQNHFALSYFNL